MSSEIDLNESDWRKASLSTVQNDSCVEVADVSSVVALRDSKDPDGPTLVVSRRDFERLAQALKDL